MAGSRHVILRVWEGERGEEARNGRERKGSDGGDGTVSVEERRRADERMIG